MARLPIPDDEASAQELEIIDELENTAFWKLMLVDDLTHGQALVEILVERLRGRIGDILTDARRRTVVDLEELEAAIS
jgi:hypothetical protein